MTNKPGNSISPEGIDSDRIYFAFLDDTLSYDCVSCAAKCCRGNGFYLTNRELSTLERHYPGLGQLAAPPPSPVKASVVVVEPPPRCFFLNKDNRCKIELKLGRSSKPVGCRLFPFNWFLAYDGVIAVGFSDLCPIELATDAAGGFPVTHEALMAELAGVGDSSLITSQVPPARIRPGFAAGIGRERRFRETSRALLERSDLDGLLALMNVDGRALMAELSEFLGIDPAPNPSPVLARSLIAITPQLRLQLLASDRLEWVDLNEISGRYVAALALFAELHQRLSDTAPSPSTIFRLGRELGPLLWNLIHLDARPTLTSTTRIQVSPQLRDPVQGFLKRLGEGATTLRLAVESAEPEPTRRSAFLRSLGNLNGALSLSRQPG